MAYRLPRHRFFTILRTRGKAAAKEEEIRDSLLSAIFEEINGMR
jgi:hypothetical protein